MFKRKRQRTISLGKKVMEALNCFRFFLEAEEHARDLGEPAEIDIYLGEKEDLVTISFLADKDFREAVAQGLPRPPDTKRKIAVVDLEAVGYAKIELYDYPRPITSKLICHRRVRRDFVHEGYSLH